MSLESCRTVKLPCLKDPRGSLVFLEGNRDIVPFDIKRVYYLFNVPTGGVRGGHAHRNLKQILIAVSGSFDVVLDDGRERKSVTLSHGTEGLMITSMVWRELENFSPSAVCLVLASEHYDEADYFRDYREFKNEVLRRQVG